MSFPIDAADIQEQSTNNEYDLRTRTSPVMVDGFDLEERLLNFTVRIVRLVDSLPNTKTANHIRGQLLRCGTAACPNYAEARDAESTADFIHKLKIVLKELRETKVWLILILRTEIIFPKID